MNRIRLSLFLDRHSSAAGLVLALVMAELAWDIAEEYFAQDEESAADAQALRPLGDVRIVNVDATFDGIGADEVEELT